MKRRTLDQLGTYLSNLVGQYAFDLDVAEDVVYFVCRKFDLPIISLEVAEWYGNTYGQYRAPHHRGSDNRYKIILSEEKRLTYKTLIHELGHHLREIRYQRRELGFFERHESFDGEIYILRNKSHAIDFHRCVNDIVTYLLGEKI